MARNDAEPLRQVVLVDCISRLRLPAQLRERAHHVCRAQRFELANQLLIRGKVVLDCERPRLGVHRDGDLGDGQHRRRGIGPQRLGRLPVNLVQPLVPRALVDECARARALQPQP